VRALTLPEPVETGPAHQLLQTGSGRLVPPAPDQHHRPDVRDVEQETLEQGLTEEPGDPRDQDALATQGVSDGPGPLLYHAVDNRTGPVQQANRGRRAPPGHA